MKPGAQRLFSILTGAIFFVLLTSPISSVVAAEASALEEYPVRVTLTFDYLGERLQPSYVTTVTKRRANPMMGGFTYTYGRDRIAFKLPDGSIVILLPEWLREGLELGRPGTRSARWFWEDKVSMPDQLIYGDGATRRVLQRTTPAPFTWLEVNASIERLNQSQLREAQQADKLVDAADNLRFSNNLGGRILKGTLFTGTVIVPVTLGNSPDEHVVERLKAAPTWVETAENCRFKPLNRDDLPAFLRLTTFANRVGLLRKGTRWTPDGGPAPGEPVVMYSTDKAIDLPSDGFSVLPFRSTALEMVHEVEWNTDVCSGLAPAGESGLALEFPNGRLMLVLPSDHISVLSR